MSFSSQVKDEAGRIRLDDNGCILCELSAMVRLGGVFNEDGHGEIGVILSTENATLIRRMFLHIIQVFRFHPSVIIKKSRKLKKRNLYTLQIRGCFAARVALGDLGLAEMKDGIGLFHPPESLAGNECCMRSFLRGAFLICGSISKPEKSYHLEMVSHHLEETSRLQEILRRYGICAKVVERRNAHVCYLKESEQIVDLLNIIGAHNALMSYENIRIVKQMRNNVNRAVNCETANLGKTVDTSIRQTEAIGIIMATTGLEVLPEALKTVAVLRMEHQEASLEELGSMLSPPLGKSGIYHRLRRIEEEARKIREQNPDHPIFPR